MPMDNRNTGRDRNRDPITNEPGSHPVGTGVGAVAGGTVGAAGGAAAGAATGTAAGGPVGTAVGAAAGAVAGGLAGKGIAEKSNPTGTGQGYDYSRRNLENYVGYDVYDKDDNKIGTLEGLWTDQNGSPAFIGVRTGWIFGKTHIVPANEVHVSERREAIRIPYTTDQVKAAATFDPDVELSEDQERQVYRHYGVSESSWWRQSAGRRPTPEQATIQLSEEQLRVGKRDVEVGGVRLRKIVRTETVNQPVELKREELVVERVPASEAHSGRQQAFTEQEVYIPLRQEEAVVGKEQVLREEVRVRKSAQTEQQQVSESVRKEDIEIEETGDTSRIHTSAATAANRLRQQEEKPRSERRHTK